MSHDDYSRIVFIILKSLYEYKKAHKKFDLDEISAEVLKIKEGYRDEIISGSKIVAILPYKQGAVSD